MSLDTFSFWPLWLLLAADVATTLYVLHRGGSELNPLMRVLMRRMGAPAALVASHVAIGWAAWYFGAYIGIYPLWLVTAFYALVVGRNLLVIRGLRG